MSHTILAARNCESQNWIGWSMAWCLHSSITMVLSVSSIILKDWHGLLFLSSLRWPTQLFTKGQWWSYRSTLDILWIHEVLGEKHMRPMSCSIISSQISHKWMGHLLDLRFWEFTHQTALGETGSCPHIPSEGTWTEWQNPHLQRESRNSCDACTTKIAINSYNFVFRRLKNLKFRGTQWSQSLQWDARGGRMIWHVWHLGRVNAAIRLIVSRCSAVLYRTYRETRNTVLDGFSILNPHRPSHRHVVRCIIVSSTTRSTRTTGRTTISTSTSTSSSPSSSSMMMIMIMIIIVLFIFIFEVIITRSRPPVSLCAERLWHLKHRRTTKHTHIDIAIFCSQVTKWHNGIRLAASDSKAILRWHSTGHLVAWEARYVQIYLRSYLWYL